MRALYLIGWIWALPTTLIGFLLALLGETKFYKVRPPGVFYFISSTGPWGWFFLKTHMCATTIGAVTVCVDDQKDSAVVIRHERQHTYQTFALGILFIPAYYLASLWALIRGKNAYLNNWFEVQAYAAQKEIKT